MMQEPLCHCTAVILTPFGIAGPQELAISCPSVGGSLVWPPCKALAETPNSICSTAVHCKNEIAKEIAESTNDTVRSVLWTYDVLSSGALVQRFQLSSKAERAF